MANYEHDMAECAQRGAASVEGFTDVLYFVVASIGVPFYRMQKQLAAIRESRWENVRNATNAKNAALFIEANKRDLFDRVMACNGRVDAIEVLVEIPGLDAPKAAFVAQLLGYDVGCLDTHNLRRFGLDRTAFKVTPLKTREKRREKIAHYCDVCDRLGGTFYLWASWCEFIAALYPKAFGDGATVSRHHVNLTGANVRTLKEVA